VPDHCAHRIVVAAALLLLTCLPAQAYLQAAGGEISAKTYWRVALTFE
jgi:hypothetical protein